jgi:glutamyl-tRNA reductase
MHNDRDKSYHDLLKEKGVKSKRDVKFNKPESVLLIGCGSIGERHLKNLLEIYSGEIFVYEMNEERLEYIIKTYGVKSIELEEGMKKCDAVLICTEPILIWILQRMLLKMTVIFCRKTDFSFLKVLKLLKPKK